MGLDPEFASESTAPTTGRWYKNFRMAWIAESLRVYGFINRRHIERKFGLSTPQASIDLQEFQRLNPDEIEYKLSDKVYVSRKYPTQKLGARMTPLRAPVNASSANIDPVPSGSHIAVCDIIAFLGVQPGTGLYPKPKPTIYLRFQLPNERVEFEKDGKKQSGPRMIGNCYTFSMHEKANLRHLLESWRGQHVEDRPQVGPL